jgi:hypothetical protein
MYIIRPYNQSHQILVKIPLVSNFVYYHLLRLQDSPVNVNQDTKFLVLASALKVINDTKIC